MQLSLLVDIEKTATNVVDTTEAFDVTESRSYAAGLEMRFGEDIYENVGDLITIPAYQASLTYEIGDITYKDGILQKATSIGTEQVPKQPEEYSTGFDTNRNASTWTKRYFQIHSNFVSPFPITVGVYEHAYEEVINHGFHQMWVRLKTNNAPAVPTHAIGAWWYTAVDSTMTESKAQVYDGDYYGFYTVIKRGTALYGRTHIDAPIEYNAVAGDVGWSPVTDILEIGGFVKVKPSSDVAPFDYKHYSAATKMTQMTYSISCASKFDTLALGAIIGDTVSVVFRDADGIEIVTSRITNYAIQTHRDITTPTPRLPQYKTTVILYAQEDIPAGGSMDITINGDFISLGTIMAGLHVDAGFTNLTFSNSFIDHSPRNIDNWGNVEYIEGVKVQVFDGTVDVPITSYDMMQRLMVSLGGSTVILNGSDSLTNALPDNTSIFGSTMLIGRLSNYKLQTKLENKSIGDLATYSIKLTELT